MAKRRLYAKGIAKRDEILTTALRLFSENGYAGVSLREISEACGLTQTAALHYFDSKEELFVEILKKREASNTDAGRSSDDTLRGIRSVMRYNSSVPGLVRLYTMLAADSADSEHPAHDYFRHHFEHFRTELVRSIEERKQKSQVSSELDAQRLARIVMALSDGLQIQWLSDQSLDMAGDLEYALELLGIESRSAMEDTALLGLSTGE